MAREENNDLNNELNVETTSTKKNRLVPEIIIKILKWTALGLFAIIFVSTISWIVFKISEGGKRNPAPSSSDIYIGTPEPLDWYKTLGEIRSSTKDSPPATVIVSVHFGYEKGNKIISQSISDQIPLLRSEVRKYFDSKYKSELANEDILCSDIKQIVNNIIGGQGIDKVVIDSKNIVE